ncbi:creatininase family protein [Chloroflexota bacterium]
MAVLLEELGWPDIQEYLQSDDRLILVVGSTEQHGRHLVFGSDTWIPWEIARRVSDGTGVLLAPPVNYGMSHHHLGFPGSLSLRPKTLAAVVADIIESAHGHGFRRIFIVNGHGGNTTPIQMAMLDAVNELPGLSFRLGTWWSEPEVVAVFEAAFPGQQPGHADASETSLVMALRPEVVRLERAKYSPQDYYPRALTQQVFLDHFPHGVIGIDPHEAAVEAGERILAAAVEASERVLREWE